MHAAGVPHTRCTFHATLRHPYTLSHKAAVGKCSINSHQILSRSCAAYTPKQHQAAAPALSSHHADRDAPIHRTVHGNTVHGSIAALHLAWSHTAAVVKQASPWTMETRYRGRKALSSSERGKLAGSAGQGTPSSSVDPAPAIAIGHCNSSNQSARDPGQGMLEDRLLAPPTPMLGHTAFAIATQQAQRSSQHEPLSSQHHEAPHRNSATPSQHNQAVSAQDNDTPAPQQAGIPPPPDALQSVQPIHVLLFAPNVVDYLRLLMLAAACACQQQLWLCAGLLVCSLALDALDGVLARRLGQVGLQNANTDQVGTKEFPDAPWAHAGQHFAWSGYTPTPTWLNACLLTCPTVDLPACLRAYQQCSSLPCMGQSINPGPPLTRCIPCCCRCRCC